MCGGSVGWLMLISKSAEKLEFLQLYEGEEHGGLLPKNQTSVEFD